MKNQKPPKQKKINSGVAAPRESKVLNRNDLVHAGRVAVLSSSGFLDLIRENFLTSLLPSARRLR
jgi:hypothetical protein